jgi:hypothetical protein
MRHLVMFDSMPAIAIAAAVTAAIAIVAAAIRPHHDPGDGHSDIYT